MKTEYFPSTLYTAQEINEPEANQLFQDYLYEV